MRCLLLLLIALYWVMEGFSQPRSNTVPFLVMEYNCENLFDCRHDSLKNDTEFLPDGENLWTFSRYWRKLNDIGRVIHQCGGYGAYRHLPDIVALLEVENDSTMFMLTRRSMLKAAGYRYIITQSPDLRGVDVALLYNPLTFDVISHFPLRISPPKGESPTRDVLYVEGKTRTNDTLHIFAVHAPSRNGGRLHTERYRLAVAERILCAVDSIRNICNDANIVVLGDFNDYSFDKSLGLFGSNGLIDVSSKAIGKIAKGTYKHQGRWGSIDHILLSSSLRQFVIDCRIHDPQWLLETDSHGGYKPRRTYLGTSYHGGVSDHLPLVLLLQL